jgi:hypothetical protein
MNRAIPATGDIAVERLAPTPPELRVAVAITVWSVRRDSSRDGPMPGRWHLK